LVTVFQFSVAQANALANWTWGANALALIVAGVVSDRLRVRKPFMLAGGIGGAIMLWLYLLQAGQHPSFATLFAKLSATRNETVCEAFLFLVCCRQRAHGR